MKLTILFVLMLLLSFSKSLCQSEYNTPKKEDNFQEIQTLIRTDLEGNIPIIFEKSRFLSDRDKYFIYNEFKSDALEPFVLNLLPTLGLGSYIQGDYVAAITISFFQVSGIGLLNSNSSKFLKSLATPSIVLSYIFGLIKPWIYASSFNADLKTALGTNNIQDFSLNPNLKMFANGQVYPELSINIFLK